MIAFLVLETLMIGVFTSLDLVLFYLFFEGGLIPMFLIIGIWGGPRRVYASFKFFLYTLAGSLLMLLAIMAIYWEAGTTDIPTLLTHGFPASMQTWLWFAFLASFAVKLPMWPVHTWLPDAHVEAPTAGSVILAGILLKMGGYGFLRFSIPMFPLASAEFAPLIFALSVIAIIYTSLVALAQEDVKKLIAYSSVAHMGFVTIGVFTLTMQGLAGRHLPDAVARHRLRRALPLRRRDLRPHAHPRDLRLWRARRPHAALRLLLHGVHARQCRPARHERFRRRVPEPHRRLPHQHLGRVPRHHRHHPLGRPMRSGSIAASSSASWRSRALKYITDLTWREIAVMAPLVVLTILFGFYPAPILDASAASVEALIKNYQTALAAAEQARIALAP